MGVRLRFLWLLLMLAGISSMVSAQTDDWEWVSSLGEGEALALAWHPSQDIFAIASKYGVYFYDVTLSQVGFVLMDNINALAWAADGEVMAVAEDGIIRVLLTSDVRDVYGDVTIARAAAPMAWSPDSTKLAYTTQRGGIRIWDRATQRSTVVFDGHVPRPVDEYSRLTIYKIAWRPDGKMIASMGRDQLLVWDATTTEIQHTLDGFYESETSDMQWIGQQLRAYNRYTGDSGARYIIEGDNIIIEPVQTPLNGNAGMYTADGSLLAMVDYLQTVTVWRPIKEDFKLVAQQYFSGDSNIVSPEDGGFVGWNSRGDYLVAGTHSTMVLWQFANEELQRVGALTHFNGDLIALDFSPDGSQLAAGYGELGGYSVDGRLRVWDVAERQLLWRSEGTYGATTSVEWHPDGRHLLSGHSESNCVARIWDARTHEEVECFDSAYFYGRAKWRPNNEGLAVVAGTELFLFDSFALSDIDTAKVSAFPGGYVNGYDWSPDGDMIVSDSQLDHPTSVSIWRLADGELVAELEESDTFTRTAQGYHGSTFHVEFSPDGRWIALGEGFLSRSESADYNNTIAIYDAETGKRLHTLKGHQLGITALAWSPDNRYLLSGSLDGTARLWDLEQPANNRLLASSDDPIAAVAWSAQDDRLAVGTMDGVIMLFQRMGG